jgi:type IV pilus assembly protein PilC
VAKVARFKTYIWHGVNKRGVRISGHYDAEDESQLRHDLRVQGISVISVREKSRLFASLFKQKVSSADVSLVLRQLATLFNAGVPLLQALDAIVRGGENETLKEVLLDVRNDIDAGNSLAVAMRKYPQYFDELLCNIIDVGEQAGMLDDMLVSIADYKENAEMLKEKVKKALTYPTFILSAAVIVTALMLVFVVPQFQALFASSNIEFPLITKIVINISDVLKNNWWLIVFALGGGYYLIRYLRGAYKTFAIFLDKLILKLPIVGPIVTKAIISRIAHTLSSCLLFGVPVIDALTQTAGVAGNLVYKNAMLEIREDMRTGQQLYFAMSLTNLFPVVVLKMVAVGEDAGKLGEMLKKIAILYGRQVDYAVDNLSALLEPVIILLLALIIGGLIVALYLPIFKMGMAL